MRSTSYLMDMNGFKTFKYAALSTKKKKEKKKTFLTLLTVAIFTYNNFNILVFDCQYIYSKN